MSERTNHVGVAYSLTVIAPIVAGRDHAARDAIDALAIGEGSPLARLDGLHFSRIHVVSELVFQGPQQRWRDRLNASHLVFTSTIDGDPDQYLEALRSRAEPDTWWRFCVGYPGSADREAFRRFVREHQVDSSLFASAHAQATVAGVLESLALRERIIDFAIAARGLEPAELQRRFREEFAR
jgi:hypothetical protein